MSLESLEVKIKSQKVKKKSDSQGKKTDLRGENNLVIQIEVEEGRQKRRKMIEMNLQKAEIGIEIVEIIEIDVILAGNLTIIKENLPKISEAVEKLNANLVKSSTIIRKNHHKRRKETIKVNETLRKSSFLVKENVN